MKKHQQLDTASHFVLRNSQLNVQQQQQPQETPRELESPDSVSGDWVAVKTFVIVYA